MCSRCRRRATGRSTGRCSASRTASATRAPALATRRLVPTLYAECVWMPCHTAAIIRAHVACRPAPPAAGVSRQPLP